MIFDTPTSAPDLGDLVGSERLSENSQYHYDHHSTKLKTTHLHDINDT